MEMLNAADLIARIHHPKTPNLELQVANLDQGDIQLNAGLQVRCNQSFNTLPRADLLILPAMWGNPSGVVKKYPEFLSWLRQTVSQDCIICAVGTGSYFLAEAGLLDGLVATTHWYYFEHFEKKYPRVQLKRERFITKSGNIYCTGSVNSVRDVMLHIIQQHYDEKIANLVSSHFTHELKLSYTMTFLSTPGHNFHDDELIISLQENMHRNFNKDLDMKELGESFDLSQRTLNRRFKNATSLSPLQYLQQIRIDKAKELLKTTNLNIAEVGSQVGYSDNAYFSALFKRQVSLSPGEYRRLVRKKIFKLDI